MNAAEIFWTMRSVEYRTEDHETFRVVLLPAMDAVELATFAATLPSGHLPDDVAELLGVCRGFEFYGLEEVRFDAWTDTEFAHLFPRAIQLAGDGYGNFWVLDIDSGGNWGPVYYVSHDPVVVVRHSDDLAQFIHHVDEFGRLHQASHLDNVHEHVVADIWRNRPGLRPALSVDHPIARHLPDQELTGAALAADLRSASNGDGFAWGRPGPRATVARAGDEPVWLIEPKGRRSLFSMLLGR